MEIRSAYSPRHIVSIDQFDAGQTKQSHKKECDINVIMAKYQKQGVITHINDNAATYGDYDSTEYHEALSIIAEGDSMFAELPSKARQAFDNDPAKFMDAVNSPEGVERLKELGLAYGDPYKAQPVEGNTDTVVPNDENTDNSNNDN